MEQRIIPFDINTYLAHPDKYLIVDGYGKEYAFIAFDSQVKSQPVFMRAIEDNTFRQFSMVGEYMTDGSFTELNLNLKEAVPSVQIEGIAYLDDKGHILGTKFPITMKSLIGKTFTAHRCVLTVIGEEANDLSFFPVTL